MNKICGIYKITSPNSKVYIGQSRDIIERWKEHKKMRVKTKLTNSLSKYGIENHIFEIIEECAMEDLNCRERYWQDEFDVLGEYGLNLLLTKSEDKVRVLSEELKRTIAITNTGKKHTKKSKIKMSQSCKGIPKTEKDRRGVSERMRGKNNPFYGKKLSESHRENMSKSRKGSDTGKAKLVLSLNDGVYYNSIKEAAKAFGIVACTLSRRLKAKTIENLILV